MADYIKFWLAKMLAEILPLIAILIVIVLIVLGMVVCDKVKRMWRKFSKGSEGRG